MSQQKQQKRALEEEEEAVVFNILQGAIKSSDFATFCLLVPETQASQVLEALEGAKSKMFEWTICEEEVQDIQKIPTPLAHAIRSIGDAEFPNDKSESDLLEWLIHGESFFSKKYVVLHFIDGKRGPDPEDGYSGKVVCEITEEKYMPFCEAAEKICGKSVRNGDLVFLAGYQLMDRGEFLNEFGSKERCFVVDDGMLEDFEEAAKKKCVDWWVDEHRTMVYGPDYSEYSYY